VSDDHGDSSEVGKGMTGDAEHRGMQPMNMVQPVTPPPAPPPPGDSGTSARPGDGTITGGMAPQALGPKQTVTPAAPPPPPGDAESARPK
jgi:hypothetical protein